MFTVHDFVVLLCCVSSFLLLFSCDRSWWSGPMPLATDRHHDVSICLTAIEWIACNSFTQTFRAQHHRQHESLQVVYSFWYYIIPILIKVVLCSLILVGLVNTMASWLSFSKEQAMALRAAGAFMVMAFIPRVHTILTCYPQFPMTDQNIQSLLVLGQHIIDTSSTSESSFHHRIQNYDHLPTLVVDLIAQAEGSSVTMISNRRLAATSQQSDQTKAILQDLTTLTMDDSSRWYVRFFSSLHPTSSFFDLRFRPMMKDIICQCLGGLCLVVWTWIAIPSESSSSSTPVQTPEVRQALIKFVPPFVFGFVCLRYFPWRILARRQWTRRSGWQCCQRWSFRRLDTTYDHDDVLDLSGDQHDDDLVDSDGDEDNDPWEDIVLGEPSPSPLGQDYLVQWMSRRIPQWIRRVFEQITMALFAVFLCLALILNVGVVRIGLQYQHDVFVVSKLLWVSCLHPVLRICARWITLNLLVKFLHGHHSTDSHMACLVLPLTRVIEVVFLVPFYVFIFVSSSVGQFLQLMLASMMVDVVCFLYVLYHRRTLQQRQATLDTTPRSSSQSFLRERPSGDDEAPTSLDDLFVVFRRNALLATNDLFNAVMAMITGWLVVSLILRNHIVIGSVQLFIKLMTALLVVSLYVAFVFAVSSRYRQPLLYARYSLTRGQLIYLTRVVATTMIVLSFATQ